jgi:hypothetical protein
MCTLLNALLASLYMNDHAVHICNNSNLGNCGVPVRHLYHTDLVHLSSEGEGRLCGNIKRTIRIAFGETETQHVYSMEKPAIGGLGQQKGKRTNGLKSKNTPATNQMYDQCSYEHYPQASSNHEYYQQASNSQWENYNEYGQYPYWYNEHAYDVDRYYKEPTSSRGWVKDHSLQ